MAKFDISLTFSQHSFSVIDHINLIFSLPICRRLENQHIFSELLSVYVAGTFEERTHGYIFFVLGFHS